MKLANGYSVELSNYHKPTPLWLKVTVDIILGLAGLMEVSLPDFSGKEWIVFGAIVLKFIAKTITDTKMQQAQ